jgi:arylformamidase
MGNPSGGKGKGLMARRIVDLTHTLYAGLEGYPGNYHVEVERLHEVEKTGYQVSKIAFDSHLGTHLDVPQHITVGGSSLDEIDLRKLIGPALLFDMTDKCDGGDILPEDFGSRAEEITRGSRVLLRTGWQRYFGKPRFFEGFPGVARPTAEWLVERGVVLLGVEAPSVHPVDHLEVHHTLITRGVVVVEALANLDQLTKERCELICLPLKIRDCDGSPCRVVALEEE